MATLTPLEVARSYHARGWMPLPVPHTQKNPGFKSWDRFSVVADSLAEHFNGGPQNVGVLLGAPSGSIIDVDLDCWEAVVLAPYFLPESGAIFGRKSNPRSHHLFVADLATRKFGDPMKENSQDAAERQRAMLVEIRSTGAQTIFPGSTHESGEVVEWYADGDPVRVEAKELEQAVARLAAAALIARYWTNGNRNDLSLALAGGLLRAGWTDEQVSNFISAVCLATGDEETRARQRNVIDTARKQADGAKTTGWKRFTELTDERLVKRVCEWLEIKQDARAAALSSTWNAPEELPNDLRDVPAFDARLLPEALQAWIMDIAERMQCPAEFPSVAALVAAAALIGSQLAIRPKRADAWTVVPNLWGACVGKPGMLKTPAITEALKPVHARERLARLEHEQAMQAHDFERDYAEAQRAALKKRMQAADADKEVLRLEWTQAEVQPPVERRYIVNDTTVEKLGELLNQNPRGLLLFRDELVGWLKSLERDGREQDRSFYLETWTGSGAYTYDRVGRGTLRISNLTVSILGGIQPGKLMQYLHGALAGGAEDDGLMQRFQLLVYPDAPRTWRNVDRMPDGEAAARAHTCCARLDTLDVEALQAERDEAGTAFLRFETAAQDFFDEWRTDLENSLLAGAFEHPALQAHMAKYRSLMPSLALIFHLFDVIGGTSATNGVSLVAAHKAAMWCTFLEQHARRIYGLAHASGMAQARSILEHLRHGDLAAEFTARDVYRKQWAGLGTSADVAEPLRILEDYGWLRSYSIGKTEAGGRASTCYIAHPSLAEARKAA